MARIYTAGEILVEIMRDSVTCPLDETGQFSGPHPSGAPAIFISAAAQLGNTTKIWGGIGRDKFGMNLIKRLKKDKVDCSAIHVSEELSTAVAFVAYDSSGEREFIFHIDKTAATNLKPIKDYSTQAPIPDYFHVMGCSLMASPVLEKEICQAASQFHASGAKISFDPNIRPELLMDRKLHGLTHKIMDKCSIFLPGVSELKTFSQKPGIPGAIDNIFRRFPKIEIIHLKKGSQGSEIFTRKDSIPIPPYPIEKTHKIIDPTGAGDYFDAAFISALAQGSPLQEAGKLAAKAGAINSSVRGPMGGRLNELL